MANKKFNFYASVNNNIARIVKTWTECEKIIANPGGKKKGAYTYKQAEEYLQELLSERDARLARSKPKRNRYSNSRPKEDLSFLSTFTARPTKKTIICKLGVVGKGSTVSVVGGDTQVFEVKKSTVSAMRYQLCMHTLNIAKSLLDQEVSSIEIKGMDAATIKTLTEWAPKWKQQNWVKPNGQPRPNAELVREMLALYEQIKSKVSFGDCKTPEYDDAPF
ncbi:hypothetical protein MOU92_003887 [Vibrio parahaemolyticus]|uniref:hypothetical protein n=1 Tax=Vibrio parahaemolyticus TaxID=670 RepID=UPI0004D38640|nr:hypothetical protein [Vibrio parahaemolyticus]EIZ1317107.1 hypothetical protein [Vibrio parahaemolyticus]KOE14611.1 hypothetical protein ACS90_17235 [Vibrio parahaemolyticus]KOE15305.1 hypothetical protein ACS89_13895 [Vibrio parahaemolyticus]KOF13763.1 hypothetical protein ACX16_22775 [Vibrio parahaemolyticus]OQU50735.1 hypothetical protein EM74_008580 [Vibrio parahaemolyticus]